MKLKSISGYKTLAHFPNDEIVKLMSKDNAITIFQKALLREKLEAAQGALRNAKPEVLLETQERVRTLSALLLGDLFKEPTPERIAALRESEYDIPIRREREEGAKIQEVKGQ